MHLRPDWSKITTPSTAEIISLDEMREHVRVTTTDEARLMTRSIVAARSACEEWTRRTLLNSTATAAYTKWPSDGFALNLGPVSEISEIRYRDSNDAVQTISPANLILIDAANPARAHPIPNYDWPSLGARINPIEIEYEVGYANKESIPAYLMQGLVWCATWFFEQRHPMVMFAQATSPELPQSIRSCWQPFRDEWF